LALNFGSNTYILKPRGVLPVQQAVEMPRRHTRATNVVTEILRNQV